MNHLPLCLDRLALFQDEVRKKLGTTPQASGPAKAIPKDRHLADDESSTAQTMKLCFHGCYRFYISRNGQANT